MPDQANLDTPNSRQTCNNIPPLSRYITRQQGSPASNNLSPLYLSPDSSYLHPLQPIPSFPPSFSSSLPHPPLVSKLPTSSPPTPSSPQTTTSSLPQHPLVVRLEASSAGWSGARFDAPRSVCRPAVVVSVGCPGVACGVREPSPPSSLLSVIRDFRAADLLLLM